MVQNAILSNATASNKVVKNETADLVSKIETALPSSDWTLDQLLNYANEKLSAFSILSKKTAQQYWLLGKALNEIKARSSEDGSKGIKGNYLNWLKEKGFNYYQANKATRIADEFETLEDIRVAAQ